MQILFSCPSTQTHILPKKGTVHLSLNLLFSLLEFYIPGPIFYEFIIFHELYLTTVTLFFANSAVPAKVLKKLKTPGFCLHCQQTSWS
jgi:hypothetical protein